MFILIFEIQGVLDCSVNSAGETCPQPVMISIVNEQPFLAWKNVSKVIDMQLHFKPLLQPDFRVGDYS